MHIGAGLAEDATSANRRDVVLVDAFGPREVDPGGEELVAPVQESFPNHLQKRERAARVDLPDSRIAIFLGYVLQSASAIPYV